MRIVSSIDGGMAQIDVEDDIPASPRPSKKRVRIVIVATPVPMAR